MLAIGGSVTLYYLLVFIEFALVAGETAYWLYCMQRAMNACHSVSRASDPSFVWLTFIPFFGFVWQFIAVNNLSVTLRQEYHRRGWVSLQKNPTMESGMLSAVVVCIIFLLRLFFFLHPLINFIGALGIIFFMYRHAEQVNSYRERLEKELDPSIAFGQLPLANTNHPFANYVDPYQQFNRQYYQQQPPQYNPQYNYSKPPSDYVNHQPDNSQQQPPEKKQDDLSRWMPKENKE